MHKISNLEPPKAIKFTSKQLKYITKLIGTRGLSQYIRSLVDKDMEEHNATKRK